MKTGNVALGIIAGAAIGAVLGILFAPDKGSETRRKISNKSSDAFDGLKEKIDGFADTLNEKYESAKKGAEDLLSKGKEKYGEVKKEVSNGI